MTTLIAFDVDGTLALHNESVESHIVSQIKDLAENNKVVLISGKTTNYLSGLTRQLGLKDIYISGENGSEYMFPSYFPPKIYRQAYETLEHEAMSIKIIKEDLLAKFSNKICPQPNQHIFSVFPFENFQETLDEVEAYLKTYYQEHINFGDGNGLTFYKHCDAIDLLPSGLSKGSAVSMLADDVDARTIITVGDGVNDISMMLVSDYSIGINLECENEQHTVVKTISEAFTTLDNILKEP